MIQHFLAFIPGILENPLNKRWHWAKRHRWATQWRCNTAAIVSGEMFGHARFPTHPKIITFTAHIRRRFDQDGLRAALKPVLDGLQPMRVRRKKGSTVPIGTEMGCGLIHSDGPDCGHTFAYQQVVDRDNPGVELRVEWEGA